MRIDRCRSFFILSNFAFYSLRSPHFGRGHLEIEQTKLLHLLLIHQRKLPLRSMLHLSEMVNKRHSHELSCLSIWPWDTDDMWRAHRCVYGSMAPQIEDNTRYEHQQLEVSGCSYRPISQVKINVTKRMLCLSSQTPRSAVKWFCLEGSPPPRALIMAWCRRSLDQPAQVYVIDRGCNIKRPITMSRQNQPTLLIETMSLSPNLLPPSVAFWKSLSLPKNRWS